MNSIRLKNKNRVYDLFYRIAEAVKRTAGTRKIDNTIRLLPYTGAAKLRRIAVDTTAYPGFGHSLNKGESHKLNGSKVTLWYKACHAPTAEQIAKASYAVKTLGIPRQRYTGTLIDVFIHKGTLYSLLGGVLERDREKGKHQFNFRMFNLDDGELYCAVVEEVAGKSAIKAIAKAMGKKSKGVKTNAIQ
jgi:hypothetical protein